MSSDLRSVLHAAATVPSIEANVAAAWHRGRRMRARRLAVGGLAVVAIVAVASAAVASIVPNNDKSPIAPATTPSTRATTTTTPETTSATVPRGSTSTGVAAIACRTANLTVTLGQPSGAAGSVGYDISFRNDGPASCSLAGFPGVSFLDASGRQMGTPVPRNAVSYSTVDIAPGATAHALLVVGNPDMVSNPSCPASVPRWIRVFPPNETASVRLDAGTMRICATDSSRNYIDPVVSSPTQ